MRTNPLDRRRIPSQTMLTVPGLYRILQGAFGLGSPRRGLASQNVGSARDREGGPYNFFEADVFLPGTGNWVADPTHETPLFTDWGHGFLRQPNSFMAFQPVQVFSHQMSPLYGLGGVVPGQMFMQPLSMNQDTGGV